MAERELQLSRDMRARASKLYLRGRDYALRGLAVAHEDFTARLYQDRTAALARTGEDDIGFLYWAGASWAGALSAAKSDLDLVAELPIAGALVARVLDLDETYELGAAHEFFISYEGGRPGGSAESARKHYRRALEISGGARASTPPRPVRQPAAKRFHCGSPHRAARNPEALWQWWPGGPKATSPARS